MIMFLNFVGIGFASLTLIAILWSIANPSKRLWPPQEYTAITPLVIWLPTFSIFGCLIGLGLLGWGETPIPNSLRYGLGIPLIVFGNLAVWYEVGQFGVDQTGGAIGTLRTQGLYRFSRNPQYVADIAMIIGWVVLSASLLALPVAVLGALVLAISPFAEEPWMREIYGEEYAAYQKMVRRFF